MPAPHHSVFYRPDALPTTQPTASKHRRHIITNIDHNIDNTYQSLAGHCLMSAACQFLTVVTYCMIRKTMHCQVVQ